MSLLGDLRASVNAVKPGRTRMRNYDLLLVAAVAALLMFGLLMVFSASIALVDGPKYSNSTRYYFFVRHAVFIAVGLIGFAITISLPMHIWEKFTLPLFFVSLFMLVLVLIPHIGNEVNGAYRWIPLGPLNFQPSELTKLAMLLFAADYTVRKQKYMHDFWRGFAPMMVALGVVGILLLLEPDLGAFMVSVSIAVGILFLGGISAVLFLLLVVVLLGCFALLILMAPWRVKRIFAYLDPFDPETVQSTGYQLAHSLIAIGRGEWFGVGLGSSVEKLHYLPEAHTDFIMAVVGEELGFVGIIAVVILFLIIVHRGFEIGRQAIAMDREFSGLVAQGVSIWMGVQALVNLGVCLGLLPTKGLTLPLVSYGGSSIVMNLVAIAILMRVDYESRLMMRGERPDRRPLREYR